MGNFEKLSVLVIVVIIVMILVVALYTWTGDPSGGDTAVANVNNEKVVDTNKQVIFPTPPIKVPAPPRPVSDGNKTAAQILKEIEEARIAALKLGGGTTNDPVPTPPLPEQPVVKEPRFHIVVSGDSFSRIAKTEYPGVGQRAIDALLKANPTIDPTRLALTSKVLLPELGNVKPSDGKATDDGKKPASPSSIAASIKPGSTYITKKGDSLKDLSLRAYHDGNQWHRIWVENFDEITDTDHIPAGTRLRIPIL